MARRLGAHAQYFTHDVNMRNHAKIRIIRKKFSHKGYSTWCMILEVLSGKDGFEVVLDELNREIYAEDFDLTREEFDEIYAYLLKLRLLVEEGGITYSPSLREYMSEFLEYRKKQSERGKAGAKARWGDGGAIASDSTATKKNGGAISEDSAAIAKSEFAINLKKSENSMAKIASDSTAIANDSTAIACNGENGHRVEYSRVEYSTGKEEKETALSSSKEKPSENFSQGDFSGGENPAQQSEGKPRIPYAQIEAAWNAQRGDLPKLQGLSETRMAKVKARWAEFGSDPMATYQALLGKIGASSFLQGKAGKSWKAKFDWLFENDTNWRKVLEGQYDDSPEAPAATSAGVRLGAGEFLQGGERCYKSPNTGNTIHVPADAPPRPDSESVWDLLDQSWHHAF